MNEGLLTMWTVYDHPADYPGHFVARKWIVDAAGARPSMEAVFAPTLEQVRAKLPPDLFCSPRQPGDEPQIVESWF
jgi:hypothetical protein